MPMEAERRQVANYLRAIGPMAFQYSENLPNPYVVDMPAVLGHEHELLNPQLNQHLASHNRMHVSRAGNSLEISPQYILSDENFDMPLLHMKLPENGTDVRYVLNGKPLNLMQASLGDLQLAENLVRVIYA